MITISEAAQEHFRRLLAGQEEPDTGIRVFVVNQVPAMLSAAFHTARQTRLKIPTQN